MAKNPERKPFQRLPNPHILAIDPGTNTGWAVTEFNKEINGCFGELIACGVEDARDESKIARKLLSHVTKQVKFIVIEDFILTPNPASTDRSGLSAVRVSARFEQALETGFRSIPVHKQMPSDAMRVVTNARMMVWGIYPKAKEWGIPLDLIDHARDATRHAVLFMRRLYAKEGNRI